tara:strand:- start:348 stop:656 length:309 start_codon:yes stop_codon:yes gene_type:complete
MIIYIDVDETICTHDREDPSIPCDYANAIPITGNIKKANKLYDEGHTIVYWTARGTVTGIDWTDVTENQLSEWGAKHHDVKLGKPYYDLFIDDKNMNTRDWV